MFDIIKNIFISCRGPKGEKLTDEVINAYKEQDELDKESVFDQSI